MEKRRINKIINLIESIKVNKEIPKDKNNLFSKLKKIAKGKNSPNSKDLCQEEIEILTSFFKTKKWYYMNDSIFQKYKESIFNKRIKEIGYEEFENKKVYDDEEIKKIFNNINSGTLNDEEILKIIKSHWRELVIYVDKNNKSIDSEKVLLTCIRVGGKELVNAIIEDESHIGFYKVPEKVLLECIKLGEKEFVNCISTNGKHMGFENLSEKVLLLCILIGEKEFVNHTDYNDENIGCYIKSEKALLRCILIGGKEFVNNINNYNEQHIGYHTHFESVLLACIEVGKEEFVNHRDMESNNMSISVTSEKVLMKCIEVGGEEFANFVAYDIGELIDIDCITEKILMKLLRVLDSSFLEKINGNLIYEFIKLTEKFENYIYKDGSHIGFHVHDDDDLLLELIEKKGKEFVNHLNDKYEHIGFNENISEEVLLECIGVGDKEFVEQRNINGMNILFVNHLSENILDKCIEKIIE